MSMVDQALKRPLNYITLTTATRWGIDHSLGILDWEPTPDESKEFDARWKQKMKNSLFGTVPRTIAIRRLLLPRDTNHRGEVFGGALLAEIDLAGAVEARKHTKHDVATVAVKEVQFKHPVMVGDVVTFYTSVVKVGTSSIHVRVEVESSRDGAGTSVSVTAAEVVYVAIKRGADGTISKVPIND